MEKVYNLRAMASKPGLRRGTNNIARQGFSLIEVLVATTLLVIIVIMVGMVFRQSTLSWQSGISRADGNMLVRTVIGAVEREMRLAVDAREFGYTRGMDLADNKIEFVALLEGGDKGDEVREPTRIVISSGTAVERSARRLRWGNGKWNEGNEERTVLLYSQEGDVQPNLLFDWEEDSKDQNGLPLFVNLQTNLTPSEGFRGVRAVSAGRDKKFDTGDDLEVR